MYSLIKGKLATEKIQNIVCNPKYRKEWEQQVILDKANINLHIDFLIKNYLTLFIIIINKHFI